MKLFFICLSFLFNFINCSTFINLNNNWKLVNKNYNLSIINLKLPCSVQTVLYNSNIIQNPLERFNDVKLRWIPLDNSWQFEKEFQINETIINEFNIVSLILNSIDTLSTIYLNDKELIKTDNQFIPYEIDLKKVEFKNASNKLLIKFKSPIEEAKRLADDFKFKQPPQCPVDVQNGECNVNFLRKEQSSFSWVFIN
jgi:beta-mannosidase